VGKSSLAANTTGASNTAVGKNAGAANTTTSCNTYVGQNAGAANTNGDNVAIGTAALCASGDGYQNTAVGHRAMCSNTTGFKNVAVGNQALKSVTTGDQNTAIGSCAGDALTTGNSNIYVGYLTDSSSVGVDAEIAIGLGIQGSGGSSVTIGSGAGIIYNNYTQNATWTQSSDRRLKSNIQNDTLGLSFINRLNPVTYNWKPSNEIDKNLPYYREVNEKDTDITMHGLIAQEVKEALDIEGIDTFAGWDTRNDGVQVISREMFITPLINAIKELSETNKDLKSRIEALESN
jgi:hypothetical protein